MKFRGRAARALDGAPHIFTSLVLSVAIAAGAAAPFARVDFEWYATLLKRKMKEQAARSTTVLEVSDQKWPAWPEGFRVTFAVECLLIGVPLDRVSVLLGPSSIRVTEKHYSPLGTRRTGTTRA